MYLYSLEEVYYVTKQIENNCNFINILSFECLWRSLGYENVTTDTLVSARSPMVILNDSRYPSPAESIIPTTLPDGVME